MDEVYLILENGTVFSGKPFGYDGEAVGELVFTTGMTGYLETLSDPSYYGQIVMQTFPLVGNYGVISEDFGPGSSYLRAYIVRDWCQEPSNFRSEGELDSFLQKMKIPGLFGIDTRKLTRILREQGTMNAMISKKPELSKEQWTALKSYKIENAVANVSKTLPKLTQSASCSNGSDCKYSVVVWDFGAAARLIPVLEANGYGVKTVAGFDSSADELLSEKPDAVILSGGPGDPRENTKIIEEIRKLTSKNVPIFAVGLGHQMLALAQGAKVEKMKFGHRGANQAVKQVGTTRAFITSQNHGYDVCVDSIFEGAEIYINVNDESCEGIKYKNIPALAVSFEPTDETLGEFNAIMEGECKNASK